MTKETLPVPLVLSRRQVKRLRRIQMGGKWCERCRDYHRPRKHRTGKRNVDGERIA